MQLGKRKQGDYNMVKHAVLYAVICAVVASLVCALINGIQFYYSTNDDYGISSLLVSGESRSLYINYFFAAAITKMYHVSPVLNWFILVQIGFNLIGMVCINYVFLKKFHKYLAFCFILGYSVLFVNQAVTILQWTQTATIMITAGFLLWFHAVVWNFNDIPYLWQIVASAVLIVLGTMIRFSSLYPVFIVFIAGLILETLVLIIKEREYKASITRAGKAGMYIVDLLFRLWCKLDV